MGGYIKSRFPEDKSEVLLPEGESVVTIEAIKQEVSKQGNDMVVFILKGSGGQILYHYALNTGDNRWMLKKTIQAITGVKQPHGEVSIAIDDLVGRRMRVMLVHEVFQGQTKAKVGDVIIPEGVPGVGADDLDMSDPNAPF